MKRGKKWIGAGLAVVVVAVAVIILAQGGDGGSTPLNAIAKAAEVTQREPGGRAVLNVKVTSPTTPEGFTESGEMTFDENHRDRGEFTIHGLTTGEDVKIVTITDGAATYGSSDALEASLPEGKKWIELDLTGAVKVPNSSDPDPGSTGPTEGLKVLEEVEESEEVGKEDVGGVPTTHYRGTLPTSDEFFGVKVDISEPRIDVWIDGQDRVRREVAELSSKVGKISTKTNLSIDFVEFGHVPKIEIPPASEVFNETDKFEEQIQSTAEGG
jgi:hypothetical protein